mgnify:FL=1
MERNPSQAAARLVRADREQMRWEACCLDQRLAADHLARRVMALVERFDLSALESKIVARGSDPGRPAIDPRLLTALWLYGATQNVGSGRHLARLCLEHDAYRWILGGVTVSDHTLNDFRVGHQAVLDDLLAQMLAVLMAAGEIGGERISQDGTRVRAAAGSGSFRRERTLREHLDKAREDVRLLAEQAKGEAGSRARAAKERGARERQERLEAALAEMPALVKAKEQSHRSKAERAKAVESVRVSETDPEARTMKMGDGGFRPGYNVQVSVDVKSRAILNVNLSNSGSDAGQDESMRERVQAVTGIDVKEHLMDGGYVTHDALTTAQKDGVTVYAPVPKTADGRDPFEPRDDDPEAVAAWRLRMSSGEAKTIYKERAATVETVNADLKANRGLDRFRVRGLAKVKCVTMWAVLAYMVVLLGEKLITPMG